MPLYHFTSQIGETFQCGRREILRLSYPGKTIWTGPSKLVRQSDKQPASTHLTRKPENHPCRRLIARWPHDELGISLGFLGQSG
jgi:hypothetical protein